jgi:hypothetical protein
VSGCWSLASAGLRLGGMERASAGCALVPSRLPLAAPQPTVSANALLAAALVVE